MTFEMKTRKWRHK